MDRIGKYELRGTLGRGAMGTVYDGWDPAIDRRVAIKTVKLADAAADDEAAEALDRFRREAQAAGRLVHPNIVGVFDMGETEDLAYIVMEFVEGRSLKEVLEASGALPAGDAAGIIGQVLAGLEYSHRRGVIHRDIKPANILLTPEGTAKIADFGIARIASSTATVVGAILGTPAYMPPEQFLGEPADERSDLYATGATLFHLLTGSRPYDGTPTSIMTRVLHAEAPPAPSARSVSVDPRWDGVIARAMARAPADRFSSAAAFGEAVRGAASGRAADASDATMVAPFAAFTAPRVPAPVPEARRPRRVRWAIAGMGVAAACLLAGIWLALRPGPGPFAAQVLPAAPAAQTALAGARAALPQSLVPRVPVPAASAPPSASAPAPRSASAPAPPGASAPAPPSLAERRDRADAALAAIPCSAARARLEDGRIVVAGLAGSDAALDGIHRASLAADPGVSFALSTIGGAYCAVLDGLRGLLRAGGLTLVVPEAGAPVTNCTWIHPRVGPLPFPAWLRLDYFSGDGLVYHIAPAAAGRRQLPEPARLYEAGSILDFGDGTSHTALHPGKPFGTDLIVAVASSEAAEGFAALRRRSEPAQAYLQTLQNWMEVGKPGGARIAAGAAVVSTYDFKFACPKPPG